MMIKISGGAAVTTLVGTQVQLIFQKAKLLCVCYYSMHLPHPCSMNPRLSLILTAVTILSSPPVCYAAEKNDKNDDKKTPFDSWYNQAKKDSPPSFPFSGDSMNKFQERLRKELNGGSLSPIKDALESGVLGQVGYGFMMGYSSGFCLKKVSKVFAFVLGGAFIFVQTLSYGGFIQVDYDKLQRKVENSLDLNNDGKLDGKDAQFALDKVQAVLGYNMPSGGGFATGFMMGLRG